MQLSPSILTRAGRVATELMELVARYEIGQRLPPERELCQRLKVSRPTLRKAIDELRRNRMLESIQGSGTFVQRHLQSEAAPPSTRRMLIGLSVPTLEVPTIARVVSGAERQVSAMDYRLVLIHDHGDPAAQVSDINKLVEQDVDGLIIFLDRDNIIRSEYIHLLDDLKRSGKPVVLLDRYVPEVELPCVLTDTVRGMYELTEHLILSGRRRMAVLTWGEAAGIAHHNRMAGFRQAMTQYGLSPEPVRLGRLGYDEAPDTAARRVVAQWLAESDGPLPFDSIVCFLDNMAYGAFHALLDRGVRVPDDVALVGFDNLDSPAYRAIGLDLTSVDQPFAQMGQVAAEIVLSKLEGPKPGADTAAVTGHRLLAPRLIVRSSCGARQSGLKPATTEAR